MCRARADFRQCRYSVIGGVERGHPSNEGCLSVGSGCSGFRAMLSLCRKPSWILRPLSARTGVRASPASPKWKAHGPCRPGSRRDRLAWLASCAGCWVRGSSICRCEENTARTRDADLRSNEFAGCVTRLLAALMLMPMALSTPSTTYLPTSILSFPGCLGAARCRTACKRSWRLQTRNARTGRFMTRRVSGSTACEY